MIEIYSRAREEVGMMMSMDEEVEVLQPMELEVNVGKGVKPEDLRNEIWNDFDLVIKTVFSICAGTFSG